MIPAQVYCRVVRLSMESGKTGTGFLFDHADGLALVTAAHICSGEPEETVTYQQAWMDMPPVTHYLDRIGLSVATGDVAAFELPEQARPSWFVGSVPLISNGVVYGQDCYILGYPDGLASRTGKHGRLPIMKKGIFAGRTTEDGQSAWLIDAHANPGFSGGPLVYERQDKPREYAVAGIIRGSYSALSHERTEADPNPPRVDAGISSCTDVDAVLALGLSNRE